MRAGNRPAPESEQGSNIAARRNLVRLIKSAGEAGVRAVELAHALSGVVPTQRVYQEMRLMLADGMVEQAYERGPYVWRGNPVASDGPWSWTPPAEPGPEVRRVRPAELSGDATVWFDRSPAGGWDLVIRGCPIRVVTWPYVLGMNATMYGNRALVDATAEREG